MCSNVGQRAFKYFHRINLTCLSRTGESTLAIRQFSGENPPVWVELGKGWVESEREGGVKQGDRGEMGGGVGWHPSFYQVMMFWNTDKLFHTETNTHARACMHAQIQTRTHNQPHPHQHSQYSEINLKHIQSIWSPLVPWFREGTIIIQSDCTTDIFG